MLEYPYRKQEKRKMAKIVKTFLAWLTTILAISALHIKWSLDLVTQELFKADIHTIQYLAKKSLQNQGNREQFHHHRLKHAQYCLLFTPGADTLGMMSCRRGQSKHYHNSSQSFLQGCGNRTYCWKILASAHKMINIFLLVHGVLHNFYSLVKTFLASCVNMKAVHGKERLETWLSNSCDCNILQSRHDWYYHCQC